ncbi:MAG: nitric oxide reductase transcriptional regulator NorR [Desulfobulbus sp.]|nr:nitric oxide reductase transcriptional regulator NorR [Desulfobulbus sp.]
MDLLETLSIIANDLTAVLKAEDRYHRLLEALQLAVPYDSAALLRLDNDVLVPIAAKGLKPQAMAHRFRRQDHPRLDIICNSIEPTLFSSHSKLPDPFEGLLNMNLQSMQHIHACLGCPLLVRERLVGVLVFDAIEPQAFTHLPKQYIQVIASLTSAQMQTVELFNGIEREAERQGKLASDLMEDIQQQRGREILGTSLPIKNLRGEIELVAKSDFTILILGETGVGKELVARSIHNRSRRQEKPMLYLNCAAMPAALAESELFGHVKGAFTGAIADRTGKFELADKGTLFLDEIGELSLEVQAKLLRTIQEGEIQRVGSEVTQHVDVRLITATNRNLEHEVANGTFRADLFHRLNVYPLTVPPLGQRREDIPQLADHFAEKTRINLGLRQVQIRPEALELLLQYSWPGNVRELDNVISRSVLKASANHYGNWPVEVTPAQLSGDLQLQPAARSSQAAADIVPSERRTPLRAEIKAYETRLIKEALARNKGNWAAAARDLDMNRSNLHNLATRLGLRRKGD